MITYRICPRTGMVHFFAGGESVASVALSSMRNPARFRHVARDVALFAEAPGLEAAALVARDECIDLGLIAS